MASVSFRGELLLTQDEFSEFNKNLEKVFFQIYGLESAFIPWRLCPIDQVIRTHTPSSVSLAAALRELDATVDPSIILHQTHHRRSSFKQESPPPTPSPQPTPTVETKPEPKPKHVVEKVEYDKNSEFYKLLHPGKEKLDQLPEWAREIHKLLNEICHNSYIKPFLKYFNDKQTKDKNLPNGTEVSKQNKKTDNDKMDDLDFDDLNDDLDDILMDIDQNTPENNKTPESSLKEQKEMDVDDKTKDQTFKDNNNVKDKDNNNDNDKHNLNNVHNNTNNNNNVKVEETKTITLNETTTNHTLNGLSNKNDLTNNVKILDKDNSSDNKANKEVEGVKSEPENGKNKLKENDKDQKNKDVKNKEYDQDNKEHDKDKDIDKMNVDTKEETNYVNGTMNEDKKEDEDQEDNNNNNNNNNKRNQEKQTLEEILENLLLNKFENSSKVFSLLYTFFVDRFNELRPGSDDWMCAQDASLKLDELRIKKGLKDSEKLHNYPDEQPVQPVVEANGDHEPPPEPKRTRTSMEDFEHELALINNTEDYTSTISLPDVKKITDNERLEFHENVILLDQEFHLELFTVFEHAAVWKLVGNGEIELDDQNTDPKIYRGMIKWVKERSS